MVIGLTDPSLSKVTHIGSVPPTLFLILGTRTIVKWWFEPPGLAYALSLSLLPRTVLCLERSRTIVLFIIAIHARLCRFKIVTFVVIVPFFDSILWSSAAYPFAL